MRALTFREALERIAYASMSQYASISDMADDLQTIAQIALTEAIDEGHVVMSKRPNGDLVAVTRQDDEGRVLKTLWRKQ